MTTSAGTLTDIYSYDAADNVTAITDLFGNNQSNLQYDALNRLTHAEGGYGAYDWSLDPVGNRLSENLTAGSVTTTTSYSYAPGSNQLTGYTATGAAPYSLGLTPIGSLASITQSGATLHSYSYNQAERLSHIVANGVPADYTYDAFGNRLVRAFSGGGSATHLFDLDGKLLEEIDGPAPGGPEVLNYIYLDDGRLVGVASQVIAQLFYVHADRLGTPEAVSDQSQNFA